ncbi:hypothetical protein DdX_03448 [Ditylenchus destructor]|uniref:Uncharacterized protein n=1 Tax=Ditylenchus destructor TaxID=166010 RepID=A0AAD4RB93_9BILA|nr:hypothetical protein DdX_03448 [Ditylenchus destructor]
MRPLTVKGCGEVVEWFCTQRNKNNAALTRANADGFIYVWTQTGKSNKRKVDGSELRKYICQGCRTLKNRTATQQAHAGKEIPYRRLILNSDGKGEWVDANGCGKNGHFCEPKSDTELMGKQLFANHVEGIKTGSVKLPPTKCFSNLETTYSKTFSGLGENGIAEARDGGFPNREAALKKIRRVIAKKYPKIPDLQSLNLPDYEHVSYTLRSSENEMYLSCYKIVPIQSWYTVDSRYTAHTISRTFDLPHKSGWNGFFSYKILSIYRILCG